MQSIAVDAKHLERVVGFHFFSRNIAVTTDIGYRN
ncbi:hypothetical protein BH10ACT6_BH10ACT6_04950 [soil metagenome]